MSTCPSCGVWSPKGDTHTHYCIAEVKNPCPSCAALRAVIERAGDVEELLAELDINLAMVLPTEWYNDPRTEEIRYVAKAISKWLLEGR